MASETYNQDALAKFCESARVTGASYTKNPVFMLPLRNLRHLLERPEYSGDFGKEITRLVGRHKQFQLLESPIHDFLVVAALQGEGGVYPDMTSTSVEKAPVELKDIQHTRFIKLPPTPAGTPVGDGFDEVTDRHPDVAAEIDNASRSVWCSCFAMATRDIGDPPPPTKPPAADTAPKEAVAEGAAGEVTVPIEWGSDYPYREGDFQDMVTMDLFRVPVVSNTGYVMEQTSLEELLRYGRSCPTTRKDLTRAETVVKDNVDKEYILHNGPCKLGGHWMAMLRALRREAGLREYTRLKRIPTYSDFKALVEKAQKKKISDERFAEILEEDFDAHISSASPKRLMALGSELFGKGKKVMIRQFGKGLEWPREGDSDFFVVLPQRGIEMPYVMPIGGLDSDGTPLPPNYYKSEGAA